MIIVMIVIYYALWFSVCSLFYFGSAVHFTILGSSQLKPVHMFTFFVCVCCFGSKSYQIAYKQWLYATDSDSDVIVKQ